MNHQWAATRQTPGSACTTWPLPPGEYALHPLLDDGYEIAATTFTDGELTGRMFPIVVERSLLDNG